MKKPYLLLMLVGFAAQADAQNRESYRNQYLDQYEPAVAQQAGSVAPKAGGFFWEEDFGNAQNVVGGVTTPNGTWSVSGANGAVWKRGFSGTNGCWSTGIPNPTFATAANGYLIFDADSANCTNPNSNPPGFNSTALTGVITSPSIDLSAYPHVLLEFSHAARWCCQSSPLFVAVSGDGGTTWSSDIAVVAPAINTNQQATTVRLNISSVVGGSSNARIRFNWSNGTAYYWAVDDIRLRLPAENDLILDFGYISHNSSNEEYGRVPIDQLKPNMLIGGMVRNFGYQDQTNVALNVNVKNSGNVTVIDQTGQHGTIVSPDTAFIDLQVGTGPLEVGRYSVTLEVRSDGEVPGAPTFNTNTVQRRFEITDGLYSLDGIGVHFSAQQTVGDIGNNSFTGADIDFMMLTYYDITQTMNVPGIEILLATGTQADAAIYVSLHDTLDIFSNNVNNPIAQSDVYDITQQNVNAKRARVFFDDPVELQPGAYFAAVRMLVSAAEQVVRIQDDRSVPQPFYGSMIYIPGDNRVYSNGNAFAIRLLGDVYIGVEEVGSPFAAFNVFPNPASDGLTIDLTADRAEVLRLDLVSVTGAVVSSQSVSVVPGQNRHQLDVTGLPNGLYLLRANGSSHQSAVRVVVQH